MELTLQPVRVATGEGGQGQLVFHREQLVAVLVRLSSLHGEFEGHWFLEAGFGPLSTPESPSFAELDAALAWIKARLADNPRGAGPL